MKRFLALLAVCASFLPILQTARGADLSVDFFYDNLNSGNWYEVADYGYVWQPEVATDTNWRPYTDGYWAYTDQGWTWVSYEDFGWATYHYGRWARLADYGWVWVPGTEWAPAWVSWRTGGDYVGWAPLPPTGGGEVVYESHPITGHVDVEFGIGPAYYNFVDLQYIGEPVLRDRILPYERNVTVISNTVNVTNITYNNSVVYNYGPDYAVVSRYSVRPIQRLKLERQTGDPLLAVKNGNVTKVQGNTLVVAAPQKLQKATGAQAAPKQVKAKIEQPKVEKGWSNIDPKEKAQMEQRYKTETAKDVPKPNIQPRNENTAATKANENQNTPSPAAPEGKGKRKGKNAETIKSASPPVAASPGEMEQKGEGKKNRNRAERNEASPATSVAPAMENAPANGEEGKGKRNKRNKREENAAPNRPDASSPANERNELKSKPENPNAPQARENQRVNRNDEPRGQAEGRRETQQNRREQMPNAPEADQSPMNAAPGGGRGAREEAQENEQRPQQRAGQGEQQQRKGKAKKNEGEPTPPPQ